MKEFALVEFCTEGSIWG